MAYHLVTQFFPEMPAHYWFNKLILLQVICQKLILPQLSCQIAHTIIISSYSQSFEVLHIILNDAVPKQSPNTEEKAFFIYFYRLSYRIQLPLQKHDAALQWPTCSVLIHSEKKCKIHYFALNNLLQEYAIVNKNLCCNSQNLNFFGDLHAYNMSLLLALTFHKAPPLYNNIDGSSPIQGRTLGSQFSENHIIHKNKTSFCYHPDTLQKTAKVQAELDQGPHEKIRSYFLLTTICKSNSKSSHIVMLHILQ